MDDILVSNSLLDAFDSIKVGSYILYILH